MTGDLATETSITSNDSNRIWMGYDPSGTNSLSASVIWKPHYFKMNSCVTDNWFVSSTSGTTNSFWAETSTNITSTTEYPGSISGWIDISWNYNNTCEGRFWWNNTVQKSPSEKIRDIMRERQSPDILIPDPKRRKPIPHSNDPRELKARKTLKMIVGKERFQRYLKDGFMSVKAKSGKIYQLFPNERMTCVYQDGQMTHRLCIHLKGRYPPTDALVTWYVLVTTDEQRFWNIANSHPGVSNNKQMSAQKKTDFRSLQEMYKEIKNGNLIYSKYKNVIEDLEACNTRTVTSDQDLQSVA